MKNGISVNWIGEFCQKDTEIRFRDTYFAHSKKLLRRSILLSGIIYFSLFLYDILYYGSFRTAFPSFASRFLILLFSIFLFLFLKHAKKYRPYSLLVTGYELLLMLSYFFILLLHKEQGYFEQGMVMIIFFLLIFLIPNRWVYCLAASVITMAFYFTVTPLYIRDLSRFSIAEAFIYQTIVLIFVSIYTFRNNSLQRQQFVRKEQLELLSVTDELTGIFNRKKFDEALDEWISITNRDRVPFSVIMYDLDDFKVLNDTWGHLSGDQTLIACAEAVKSNIRLKDMFFRWGGEEFMILLPLTMLHNAGELAERLRIRIAEIRIQESVSVTASFGVAEFMPDEAPGAFLERLDNLMYKAKRNGKNRVEL